MRAHERLEARLCEWLGLPVDGRMVACSSGTAALHLAMEAMSLPAGSEVIVPDYTMVACPRAVALAGLRPVFADCAPDLTLDPIAFAGLRNSAAQAVMPVHVYGRRCQDVIFYVADDYHLRVVEDMAELHGVAPREESDAACWSFYRNKVVAGEEGGAVWLRDPEAAERARRLRCLGFTAAHDYVHEPRGHNYRLADSLAELVLRSLDRYAENVEARRRLEAEYEAACPTEWRMPARVSPWVYDLRVPGLTREAQVAAVRDLNDAGIGARVGFWPMTLQPEFGDDDWRVAAAIRADRIPRSWRAGSKVICLPLTPAEVSLRTCRRAMEVLKSRLRP